MLVVVQHSRASAAMLNWSLSSNQSGFLKKNVFKHAFESDDHNLVINIPVLHDLTTSLNI